MNNTLSPLLENAVTELSRLPGVGRKTALRLAFHLLRAPLSQSEALAEAIQRMRRDVRYCRVCHNISDTPVCPLCDDARRDASTVCVVETPSDVIAIESTGCYRGLYHVLGGLISPMDGVGPDRLEIDSLVQRVKGGTVGEVILALAATMEGDTTNYYIYKRLRESVGDAAPVVTQLARGVAVGNEIEYTDHLTLGRSLDGRTPFTL